MASDFKIDVGKLRTRPKDRTPAQEARLEAVAEDAGFVDRTPKKPRGRPKSPRTGQVHAKVMPKVSAGIAAEAQRRGCQQGVILEEAWELYCAEKGL